MISYLQKSDWFLIKKIVLVIVITTLILLAFMPRTKAADIGGKVSLISNLSYIDSEIDNSLASELELEWYLPYDFPLDIQNRAVISLDEAAEDKIDIWFKKLYLRQQLGPLTAKLGRQPVSWSYGSLINPVDYTLGAENLEEESRAKFVDGVELYYPINWGSGLAFVVSDVEAKDHKWAFRARTTFRGYDLTANYVRTPKAGEADFERYGLTAKGDLGPLGVYAASGFWQEKELDNQIYQIGADYSYQFLRGSRLLMQGEYLRLEGIKEENSIFDFLNLGAADFQNSSASLKNNLDFLNTSISYEIDEFSVIGIMTVSYLDDFSTIIIPTYSYLFSSNLQLELRGSLAAGADNELLGGDAKAIEMTLSYTF